MKNIKLYCLIAFAVVTAFYSCKSKEEKNIVNYWKLTHSRNPLRDSLKFALMTNITSIEEGIDTIKKAAEKRDMEDDLAKKKALLHYNDSLYQAQESASFLEIKGDGLYDCNLFDAREVGNWKFSKDKSELITIPAGGNEDKLKVMKISKDTLILGEDENNYMLFVSSPKK